MKRTIYLFVFLFAGMISFANAQGNWVGIDSSTRTPAEARLVESNIQETTIQFSLDGYVENAFRTPNGTEMRVSVPDGVQIMEEGKPDLAKLTTTIIIPDTDEMEINVVSKRYEEFTDVAVAPSKGHFTRDINPDDVPFTYGEAYETDAFWPGDLAQLEDPFIMRDFRGQTVTIFPYQYNPVSQTLRVYTDIVVEVTPTGREGQDALHRTRDIITLEPEFKSIYERFFLNMQSAERGYPLLDGEEGSMLIIAYDDFMDAMQPFVDWKRTTGRQVELVSLDDVGSSSGEIKSYVDDYYADNEDFAYLLLVGDGPQIPVIVTSNGDSDNAYGFIEGTNSFNDIFVGRFSAETVAHVETQVQRTIEYERDLDESDTWLNTAMGVARNEGAGGGHHGEADYVHMDFIKDTLLNFTYDEVHRNYDGNVPGHPNTTAAEISANIEDGVSAINFCNHGSVTGWSVAGYNISHVNNLDNAGRLPYLTNVACVNGDFVNNFSFSEAWMRATNDDGEPTGTVANMSATINQLWQPPMCGQDEMVSIKTEASIEHGPVIRRTYGGISINGSMFMIPQYGSTGIQTHETWVLFGDPSLLVRTDAPEAIAATYNPVMFIGMDQFELTAPDADGATVAMTYYDEVEEEVVILGTAIVEDGNATVHFDDPPDQPMDVTLAITGFNKVTYINEEIQVIPPDGPYVILDDFVIDDSEGNNDGEADYGETVMLDVTLENVGIEMAENVHATLATENENVTIVNDFAEFGDIDDEDTVTLEGAFTLTFAEDVPDQHAIMFTLHVEDDSEEPWESTFPISVNAPELEFTDMYADGGDDDKGTPIHPGQASDLVVEVTNTGHSASEDIHVLMESNEMWVTVHDTDGVELSALEPGETAEAVFTVSTLMTTPPETFVDLLLTATTGEYAFEGVRQVVVGEAPVYSDGDLPSTHESSPGTGDSAIEPGEMTVSIPNGATITGVTVEYEITSHNGAWMSEQRSFLRCVSEGGETEPNVISGSDNSGGTMEYLREDLDIANNVEGGGDIEFELHVFHTWEGMGGPGGSNTEYAYVPNETWKLIVYYDLPEQDVTFFVENQFDETLEGASVEVFGVVEETDGTGHADFNLPEGSFYYNAWADGHRTIENEPFDVIDGENYVHVELLRVFNATFAVTDYHGNDVPDAMITIDDHTYEEGHHEIDDLLPGTYAFTVSAEGHKDYTGELEIVDDHVQVDATLMPFYTAHFIVHDQWGTAVEDATITIDGDTHDAGQYEVHELIPDTYEFVVSANFYHDYEGEIEIVDDHKDVEVVMNADGTDITEVEDANLVIYPNPASTNVTVQSDEQITGLRVVDMQGQVIYDATVSGDLSYEVDLSGVRTGIYLIQVTTTEDTITTPLQVTR